MTEPPQTDAKTTRAADPYRELFERSADAILIIENERFVDCNQATVELLRYANRAEVLGTHPSVLSPARQPDGRDSYSKAEEMMDLAFAKGSHRFEWDHVRADGEVFPVEVLLTAVPSAGRRVLHVVWRDISERKRLEEAVRQSQKLEALGRLAGGIAHDFNNLLVAINCNAELLALRLGGDPEGRELVDEITAAGLRAAALVRQLLTFSRRQNPRLVNVELGPLLRELEKMLRRLLPEHFELRIVTTGDRLSVNLGDGYFEQLVVNLMTNARDAMDLGGPIAIELRGVDAPDVPGLTPGRYAELTVSDRGHGMSAEIQRHAFDPFFTTKDVGKGTGLGLSMVYAIATRSGGTVALDSVVGRGTTVRVLLPLAEPGSGADEERPDVPVGVGVGTILVVEDELEVARAIERALTRAGFRVVTAGDGLAALERWRVRGDIDLVLSDVVMPRLGGVALGDALRAAGYTGPLLFMSGYTERQGHHISLGPGADLIEKPFSNRELLARIQAALSAAKK